MTQKQYRTAQGKLVDLGALQLQNENVRAVGNMAVNGRGDMLDAGNKPIDTRNQQVARQYQKQVTNVQDTPVYSSRRSGQAVTPDAAAPDAAAPDATASVPEQTVGTTGGLAGAIARARTITQSPVLPNSRPTGIRKI